MQDEGNGSFASCGGRWRLGEGRREGGEGGMKTERQVEGERKGEGKSIFMSRPARAARHVGGREGGVGRAIWVLFHPTHDHLEGLLNPPETCTLRPV